MIGKNAAKALFCFLLIAGCSKDRDVSTNGIPNGNQGTAFQKRDPLPPSGPREALPPEQLGIATEIPDNSDAYPTTFFKDAYINESRSLATWIPPDNPKVRGIFFTNSFYTSVAPKKSDPSWRMKVAQKRLMAYQQIASLWDFAHLYGTVWRDKPRRSNEEQLAVLDSALAEFAKASGHKELTNVPLVIIGDSRHSAFGPWLAQNYPERVVAYVPLVGGAGKSPAVPGLQIVGEDDGGQGKVDGYFYEDRAAGAQLGTVLMWGVEHICNYCEDIAWPFFDRSIQRRMDATNGALRTIPMEEGWLTNVDNWSGAYTYDEYPAEKTRAGWLPDQYIASVWEAVMLKEPTPAEISSPTEPGRWGKGFGEAPSETKSSEIHTIVVKVNKAISGTIEIFNGSTKLGETTRSDDGKKATLENVSFEPGMHVLIAVSDGHPVSRPAGLIVLP